MKRAVSVEHPLGFPLVKAFDLVARNIRGLESDQRQALVTAEFRYDRHTGACTEVVKKLTFTDSPVPRDAEAVLQFVIERRDDGWCIPDEEAVKQAYWAKQVQRLRPKSTVDSQLVRLYGAATPKHTKRGFVSRSQRPTYNLDQYDY